MEHCLICLLNHHNFGYDKANFLQHLGIKSNTLNYSLKIKIKEKATKRKRMRKKKRFNNTKENKEVTYNAEAF